MKATDASQPDPQIFHVGTRTRAFDALGEDLLVVAYEESLGESGAEELIGLESRGTPKTEVQPVVSRQGNGKKGYLAFKAQPEAIYRLHGVEYVPVHRVRYVLFDKNIGYRELNHDEALAILAQREQDRVARQKSKPIPADPNTWPTLKGTAEDVRKAAVIRLRAHDMLAEVAPDLLPDLLWHSVARWYLRYDGLDAHGWMDLLKAAHPTAEGAGAGSNGEKS